MGGGLPKDAPAMQKERLSVQSCEKLSLSVSTIVYLSFFFVFENMLFLSVGPVFV